MERLDFIRGHSEESYSGHIKYICAGTALLRDRSYWCFVLLRILAARAGRAASGGGGGGLHSRSEVGPIKVLSQGKREEEEEEGRCDRCPTILKDNDDTHASTGRGTGMCNVSKTKPTGLKSYWPFLFGNSSPKI